MTVFTTLAAILHGWRLFKGTDGFIRYHDTFDSEFPRFVLQARAWLETGPVAWLAQLPGGMPVDAHHFTALHPLVLAHVLLPPWAVFDILLIVNFLTAGYGTYRLLAINFGVRHQTALLTALAYASFAQAVLPIAGAEAAIPLIISLLHAPSPFLRLRLGGAVAGMALTAYAYPILHGPALAMVQTVYLSIQWARGSDVRREIVVAVAFWVAMIAMFAPNIVSLLDFLPYNHRSYIQETDMSLGSAFLEVAGHILRQGGIWLLAGLAGGLAATRWDRGIFVAGAMLVAAVVLVFLVTPPLDVLFRNSFLAKMDLYQAYRGLPALYAMVMGLALDRAALVRGRLVRYVLGVVVALAVLAFGLLPLRLTVPALVVSFLVALVLGAEASKWISSPGRSITAQLWVLSAAILAAGTLSLSQTLGYRYADVYGKYAPPPELLSERTKEPFRVALHSIPSSPIQTAGLETVDGRGPLFFVGFKRLLDLIPSKPAEDRRRLFWKYHYELRLDILTGKVSSAAELRLGVLAAMNVRYILSGTPIAGLEQVDFPSEQAKTGYRSLIIYRVPNAKPRGYLAPDMVVTESGQEALEVLRGLSDADWRRTAVFSKETGAPSIIQGEGDCGESTITRYGPDEIVFNVRMARECPLIVANNFHKRWKATIDGVADRIYPVNSAFMAVTVPRGDREVRLSFRQPGFPTILSLVPLGWAVLLAAFMRRPMFPVES